MNATALKQPVISALQRFLLLPNEDEIYYIGGADVLPAPLEPETEAKMIEHLEDEESESAKSTLIEHNLRLVVYIAKKFESTGIGIEDLVSIGTIGLIKGINSFNLDKNIKLATYTARCIENEILMVLRSNKKTNAEVFLNEPIRKG